MLRRGCIHVLALAFWLGASMHCRLSALPAFQFLACADTHHDTAHEEESAPGDACSSVESASYRSKEDAGPLAAVDGPPFTPDDGVPSLPPPSPPAPARPPPSCDQQAEADSWHLATRAAGSPRAPASAR